MTVSARFGVDPAELLAAASAAGDVTDRITSARTCLRSVDRHAWATDPRLAAVVAKALVALAAAAQVAADSGEWLERGLRVSAEGYARSDSRWAR